MRPNAMSLTPEAQADLNKYMQEGITSFSRDQVGSVAIIAGLRVLRAIRAGKLNDIGSYDLPISDTGQGELGDANGHYQPDDCWN